MADLYGNPFQSNIPGGGSGTPGFGEITPGYNLRDFYYNSNPSQYYQHFLNEGAGGQQNFNPFSRFGQFAKGQQGYLYGQYQAEAPQHELGYTFSKYLDDNGGYGSLQRQFQNLDPSQRGLNTSAYGNKLSWVGF